jgi:DNA-binding LacI/PurR family transcriptional regulator
LQRAELEKAEGGRPAGSGRTSGRTSGRPTIEDVAALAGVSRGTVSRVLNGGRNVSAPALAAVRNAISKTGYVANHHARSLVTQRSGSVAFILSEPQERLFEDPNFGILLRGCTQALAEVDLTLLLSVAGTEEDRMRIARFVAAGHVDGVLLISTHFGHRLIGDLADRGVPVVACGEPLGHESRVSYVSADDRGGARQMVSYLRSAGRRRIGTVTGPLDAPGGTLRLAGYRDVVGGDVVGGDAVGRHVVGQHAVGRDAASELIAYGDYTEAGGLAATDELLRRVPDLDGLFVASDLMARGAMRALSRAGRRVPQDVAVGGFDDSSAAVTTDPPLTTIRQPWTRLSSEMVRLLLARIAGEPPSGVILPTELVRRGSA